MSEQEQVSGHTAGLLRLFSKRGITAICDEDGNEVVHWMGFDDSNISKSVHKANARRLVATWNAYQDVDTETLETLQEHGVTLSTASPLVKARADEAEALLRKCEEYFDQRADAEYFPDSPRPHANEEMGHLTEIRDFLEARKP
ncbi:MAG TPA: hypothetical protein ENH62_08920 [Marinobacter sp.]|uniref:Uncharacterized protein n=1 Tax=marine sediment metagenome TaxID=412755 RepID=A0A0F9JDK0_9ZZZZ|nr:hypothetical protein [Marinobacter sp.]